MSDLKGYLPGLQKTQSSDSVVPMKKGKYSKGKRELPEKWNKHQKQKRGGNGKNHGKGRSNLFCRHCKNLDNSNHETHKTVDCRILVRDKNPFRKSEGRGGSYKDRKFYDKKSSKHSSREVNAIARAAIKEYKKLEKKGKRDPRRNSIAIPIAKANVSQILNFKKLHVLRKLKNSPIFMVVIQNCWCWRRPPGGRRHQN